MAKRWPEAKDPDEILDFGVDWSAALAGDVIATSAWALPPGITGIAQSHTDTATMVRLAGGSAGADYQLLHTITTLIGRRFVESRKVRVRTK